MSMKERIKDIFSEEDFEYDEEYTEDEGLDFEGLEKTRKKIGETDAKLVLFEPRAFSEAQEIAEDILKNNAVIVALHRINSEQSRRIVDFLSGTVYAIDGNIQKLMTNMILCTPSNFDVAGSISEVFQEAEEL